MMTNDPDVRMLRIAPLLRGIMAEPSGNADTPYRRVILESFRVDDAGHDLDPDVGSLRLTPRAPDGSDAALRELLMSAVEA